MPTTTCKDKQLILAVTREALFGCFLQYNFNGFIREELFSKQIQKLNYYNNSIPVILNLFSERGPLELDVNCKQIIPYVIIGSKVNETFLTYTRPNKGNESRLHGKISIGFGGHIETCDTGDAINLDDVIINCARREIKEELSLWTNDLTYKTLGYINDDSNPVGRVHFGVVLYLDVSSVSVDNILTMLADNEEAKNMNFRTLADIQNPPDGYEYETWSKHVIDALPYINLTSPPAF